MSLLQAVVFITILLYLYMTLAGSKRIIAQTFDPTVRDFFQSIAVSATVHALAFGLVGGLAWLVMKVVA